MITVQHSASVSVVDDQGRYLGSVFRNGEGSIAAVSRDYLPARADGYTSVACASIGVGVALLRAAAAIQRGAM